MKHAILAIETATDWCSVALIHESECYSRGEFAPKEHTQLVFPMIESLLAEANMTLKEITAIAVGRGPGSFTGVRIAMSIAQGLGYGLNLPVYGVSTLEALAYQAKSHLPAASVMVMPALDARMQEVYSAAFIMQANQLQAIGPEKVCLPQDLFSALPITTSQEIVALGSGWETYLDIIQKGNSELKIHFLAGCAPHAEHIGLIAQHQIAQGHQGVPAQAALPVYIRDDVAKKSVVASQ